MALKLEENFTHKGFIYKQIKREKMIALFEFTKEGWKNKYYDVITIREMPDYTFPNGTFSAAHEVYPNDNLYGKSAWCFSRLDMAENKYNELINKPVKDNE